MTKKAVVYARQSNVQDGNLGRQVRECKLYAREQGLEVVQVLEDKGTGQSKLFERVAGRQLFELILSGSIDVVIAHEISRFTRDRDGAEDLKMVRSQITGAGLELHFTKEGVIDGSWDSDKVLVNASLDSHEFVRTVRSNTLGGKYNLLDQGIPVWTGQTAYGYDKHYRDLNGHKRQSYLEINPVTSLVVKDIFEQYAKGVKSSAIAKALNSAGTPAPNGSKWGSRAIENILNRELYKGTYNWGKYENV